MTTDRVTAKGVLLSVAMGIGLLSFIVAGAEFVARKITGFDEDRARRQLDWAAVSLDGDKVNSDAYRDYPWAQDFIRQPSTGGNLRYEPFVLWTKTASTGKYVNWDEDGQRRTVNPERTNCRETKRVMVLGGSAIAGDGILRDEDLVPSRLSELLNAAASETCFEVKNFGQTGYNQGNEYVLLMRLLAKGERPQIVIFYDGVNDVVHRVVFGQPHMAYPAFHRLTQVWAGNDSIPSLVTLVMEKLSHRSALVGLALRSTRLEDSQEPSFVLPSEVGVISRRASQAAELLCGQMYVVGRLGSAYGFATVFALQPMLFTKARPSAEERRLIEKIDARAPAFRTAFEIAYPIIIDHFRKADGCGVHFADLRSAIDTDRSVYVDFAHVSPLGNSLVAKALHRAILERALSGDPAQSLAPR